MSGKVTDNLGRASGLSKAVAAGGAGKILQVVTGTSSTEVSVTATSYTDSGLDVAITPSATSSKIYIIAATSVYQTGGYAGYITLYRDSSNLADPGTIMTPNWASTNGNNIITPLGLAFLDSPSSTSEITYSVFGRAETAGQSLKMNNGNAVGAITAFEIDGS